MDLPPHLGAIEQMFAGVAFRAWGRDHQDLVDRLKGNEVIRTDNVERAFRLTDRALFVPYAASARAAAARAAAGEDEADEESEENAATVEIDPEHMPRATAAELAAAKEQAYMDAPVRIGLVHVSAPHMYALVLERLHLQPGMSFLNLGSGSGWLSCMAALLVGSNGISHGVEINSPVVEHARRCTAVWRRRIRRWKREQMKESMQQGGNQTAAAEAASLDSAAAAASPAASSSSQHQSQADVRRKRSAADAALDADELDAAESDGSSSDEMHDNVAADAAATMKPPPPPVSAAVAAAQEQSTLLPHSAAVMIARSENEPAGPPRRGVIGPAPDLVLRGTGEPIGDAEAERAVRQSVMPVKQFVENIYKREINEEVKRAANAAAAIAAAADAATAAPASSSADVAAVAAASVPVPSPAPSPSPTPSAASSTGESVSSEFGGPGATWHPTFPVPLPAAPQYLAGDAFDVSTDILSLRYDRIYIGAALPDRFIPHFAQLLHPYGKLIAPFGDAFKCVSKRADGSIRVEHITSVGYAEMRLPEEGRDQTNRPRLSFAPPALRIEDDYSSLPRPVRQAIHAIFMLQARDERVSLPGKLPLPLWMHILSFCARDWWLDRSTGEVPWALSPQNILIQVREKLNKGEEQIKAEKWTEADDIFEECTRMLGELRDLIALQAADDSAAATSATSISSASPSSISDAASSLQQECWLQQLLVLRHLKLHARSIRLSTDLLKIRPNDLALLYAKAVELVEEDELPQAEDILNQIEIKLNPKKKEKEEKGETKGGEEGETEKSVTVEEETETEDAKMQDAASSVTSTPLVPLPFELTIPTLSLITSLRSRISSGMPSYRRRQHGASRSFLQFMARLVAGDMEQQRGAGGGGIGGGRGGAAAARGGAAARAARRQAEEEEEDEEI